MATNTDGLGRRRCERCRELKQRVYPWFLVPITDQSAPFQIPTKNVLGVLSLIVNAAPSSFRH